MVELVVSSQTADQQSSELLAVGFFQDERPLRSEAGLIDGRMNGMISSRLEQGFMTGQVGETTLIPGNGRIGADKILLVGLGEIASFCYGRVRDLTEHVVKTCNGLQVHDLAIAFQDPLRFGLEWAKLTEALVEGVGLGLKAAEPLQDIRIRLPGAFDYYDQIVQGVETARKILRDAVQVKVSREPSSLGET